MLEQVELGHTMPGSAVNGQVVNRQAARERLLRVVAQKQKAASFLQRLKEWRLKRMALPCLFRAWRAHAERGTLPCVGVGGRNAPVRRTDRD